MNIFGKGELKLTDVNVDDGVMEITDIIKAIDSSIIENFTKRVELVKPDIYNDKVYQAVGSLFARQSSLTSELAINPGIWTIIIAPLILRAMIEVEINIKWIMQDPIKRSDDFVLYGLGQEKLLIEVFDLMNKSTDVDYEDRIENMRNWLEYQKAAWAIDVNVGSWSNKSIRDLAKEVGMEDIYKTSFNLFSFACHSTWNYVGKYNITGCKNPLHKYHLIPELTVDEPNYDVLKQALIQLSSTTECFDKFYSLKPEIESPIDVFRRIAS